MGANFVQLWNQSVYFRASVVLCVVGGVVLYLNSGGGSQPGPAPTPAPAASSQPQGLTNPLTGNTNAPAKPLNPAAPGGLTTPKGAVSKATGQAVQIGQQVIDGVSNQFPPPSKGSPP
jgi:hypothetical protein